MNPYVIGSWNRIILVCCLIIGGFIFFFIISTLGQKLLAKNEAKMYKANNVGEDESNNSTNTTTITDHNV